MYTCASATIYAVLNKGTKDSCKYILQLAAEFVTSMDATRPSETSQDREERLRRRRERETKGLPRYQDGRTKGTEVIRQRQEGDRASRATQSSEERAHSAAKTNCNT